MTDEELEEVIGDCPILYHMAERDSWQSIEKSGLLSTTALLDKYGVSGTDRDKVESARRPASVVLQKEPLGRAVVRDQSPMDDSGLLRCLQDGLLPQDWYRLLNNKVFFWLTRPRLLRLLNAGNYRSEEHDVLLLDTAPLISACKESIWFCPINSGSTKPFPHPRGNTTFSRIPNYPYAMWKKEKKRPRGERVVELAIDYSVPDVKKFVRRVVRMKGNDDLQVLWER
ncbi:hypothetical protein Q3C01_28450 [Bradyrhizobium sp. UFLA05-109]